jgi:hypothetical protein
MLISAPVSTADSPDTSRIGWTDLEGGRSLTEAMTLHFDSHGSLAHGRVHALSPLTSPEALAQRARERIADGMLRTPEERIAAMRRIAARVARLPILDDRSPDEILGYDESGLPT